MKRIIKTFILLILINFSMAQIFLLASEDSLLKIGNEDSKVTVKVFSSLTCPHCANFHKKVFYDLKKEYIDLGKVKFEHHSFPLDLAALNAEKVVRCSSDVEKRFQLLSKIYESQNKWAVGSDINKINDSIKKIGLNLGLSSLKIDKCLKDEKVQEKILNERIEAQKKYKIESTPTIYINKKKYNGDHDYKKFKKSLEKLL